MSAIEAKIATSDAAGCAIVMSACASQRNSADEGTEKTADDFDAYRGEARPREPVSRKSAARLRDSRISAPASSLSSERDPRKAIRRGQLVRVAHRAWRADAT
jgi:hypothetical protein